MIDGKGSRLPGDPEEYCTGVKNKWMDANADSRVPEYMDRYSMVTQEVRLDIAKLHYKLF